MITRRDHISREYVVLEKANEDRTFLVSLWQYVNGQWRRKSDWKFFFGGGTSLLVVQNLKV